SGHDAYCRACSPFSAGCPVERGQAEARGSLCHRRHLNYSQTEGSPSMKARREAAEKAMSAKLKRLGASGDKKGYSPKGYATGGGVTMGGQDDMGGGPV